MFDDSLQTGDARKPIITAQPLGFGELCG